MNYVLLADSIMQGIKNYSNPEVVKNLDIGTDLVTKLIDEHSHDVLYLVESMFLERVDIHVSLLYNRFYKSQSYRNRTKLEHGQLRRSSLFNRYVSR